VSWWVVTMTANSAMAMFRAVRLPTRWLPAG
jgi:hypothetical protein